VSNLRVGPLGDPTAWETLFRGVELALKSGGGKFAVCVNDGPNGPRTRFACHPLSFKHDCTPVFGLAVDRSIGLIWVDAVHEDYCPVGQSSAVVSECRCSGPIWLEALCSLEELGVQTAKRVAN
jgi:hypothetical protein